MISTSNRATGPHIVGGSLAAAEDSPDHMRITDDGTYVVLLGTQGGPIPGKRAATSSALIVDGDIYIVDAGSGLPIRFSEAGLAFNKVRGMFITHLHSDHVADYFNFFSLNWTNWDHEHQTIQVHGPGRAADNGPEGSDAPGLPSLFAPIVVPALSTPGIADITRLSIEANAYDLNERLRSTRRKGDVPLDPTGQVGIPMLATHDIPTPSESNVDNWCPRMDPIPVYQDDNVTVTATLVDHPPVFPAFAFRFETRHGSVVFSGDTSPCENLIALASGADVLVNEVMDLEAGIAKFENTPIHDTMTRQFTSAHTTLRGRHLPDGTYVPSVGELAHECGVHALVLNHLYPGDGSVTNDEFKAGAQRDYDGTVVVGDDLTVVRMVRAAETAGAAISH
ncbi:MBL fold metallo-hydrolase [Rhodococcus qingshengii]|uniref:MBL fold metallo-hydrolase n=1 Tax=Rhodococcus qingshengii TaxID=334542 RepID=UPI00287F47E7|nr:MBL fold metallo-hydrolase [Rhodococcus qingshengii]